METFSGSGAAMLLNEGAVLDIGRVLLPVFFGDELHPDRIRVAMTSNIRYFLLFLILILPRL